jgi:hypothetical protein
MNLYLNSKTYCVLIILLTYLFIGCSSDLVDPIPEEPTDTISGIYFIHGTQIDTVFTYWPWPPGELPTVRSVDTTQISFTLNVKNVEAKQDTIQFHGLLGVNAGYVRPWRNLTAILSPDCFLERDCAYAKLDGEEFILEFGGITPLRTAPYYYGTGSLKNGRMALNTWFMYRGASSTYYLEGTKVE